VAEDHRTPGAEEVEITIAVFVEEIGALGVGDEWGFAAYSAEGAHGRVDSAGKELFGALLQVMGAGEAAGHVFSIGAGCPVSDGEDRQWTVLLVLAGDMSQIIRNKLILNLAKNVLFRDWIANHLQWAI
jgi:hypothetical protein